MSTEMNRLGVVRATSRNAPGRAAVIFSTAFIALAFVLVVGRCGRAAGSPPSSLKSTLSRLQRHYQETDSFRGKFKESVTRAGGMPQLREGTIAYRKPGRMRWERSEERRVGKEGRSRWSPYH